MASDSGCYSLTFFLFERNLNCLAVRGLFALYGAASGPVPPIDAMSLAAKGSLFLTRVVARHYMEQEEQHSLERVRENMYQIRRRQESPPQDDASLS